MKLKKILALLLLPLFAFALSSCLSKIEDKADGGKDDKIGGTVNFGTMDKSKSYWPIFVKKAKEAGITIKAKNFTEYNTVNDALKDGSIHISLFQHLAFLAQYNVNTNSHLIPIGPTEIVPLGLYYKGHTSVSDIPAGTKIVIPNDSTNEGRAINVLAQAGLVTLKTEGLRPRPSDIESSSKVGVLSVNAAQTVLSWRDGTPSVINNTFLKDAGITPDEAVYKDDPSSPRAEPYINVFTVREQDRDNATYKKLVEIWHDPEVVAAVRKDSKGSSVEVKDRSQKQLEDILTRLEDDLRG